jgi:hypothetical protein
MPNPMKAHRSIALSCLAMAWLAGPAHAGDVAAAKQHVDKSYPMNCELITLQVRARGLDPESPAYRALSDEFHRKASEAEQRQVAESKRFHEVAAVLTPQEMAEVTRYSFDRTESCIKDACGGSPCPPPAIPKDAKDSAARGPTMVAPHSQKPKIESATSP